MSKVPGSVEAAGRGDRASALTYSIEEDMERLREEADTERALRRAHEGRPAERKRWAFWRR